MPEVGRAAGFTPAVPEPWSKAQAWVHPALVPQGAWSSGAAVSGEVVSAAPIATFGFRLSTVGVIYVDDDAPPGGDGSSWNTAFRFLQDALAAATAGDEVRAAGGTYKPDRDAAHPGGTDATAVLDGFAIRSGNANESSGEVG